jgi:hypothetical protein
VSEQEPTGCVIEYSWKIDPVSINEKCTIELYQKAFLSYIVTPTADTAPYIIRLTNLHSPSVVHSDNGNAAVAAGISAAAAAVFLPTAPRVGTRGGTPPPRGGRGARGGKPPPPPEGGGTPIPAAARAVAIAVAISAAEGGATGADFSQIIFLNL